MIFYMKPENFNQAYLEMVELMQDHGNPNIVYTASPRDGILEITSELVTMSEELEKKIFLWRMKYS